MNVDARQRTFLYILAAHGGTFLALALLWFILRRFESFPGEIVMLVLAVILLVGASVYAGSQPHRKIALAALATVILAESLVYWLLFAEVIAPLITFIVLHGFGFGIGSLLLRMRESGQKKST